MAVLNRRRCYWARRTDHQHRDSGKARSHGRGMERSATNNRSCELSYPPVNAEAFTAPAKAASGPTSLARRLALLCHAL